MLLPEQVVPFLQHDDPIVRDHALDYFRDTYQFGPLTADNYWAVIDRLGENDSTLGFASGFSRLPQTEASVDRLFLALGRKSHEDFEFHYTRALQELDVATLQRNRERWQSLPLSPETRNVLDTRLGMIDMPPADAWEQLMKVALDLGDKFVGDFDGTLSDALTEVAARGDRAILEQAFAALREYEAVPWRAIFAAVVLGLARYAPAIDALVQTLAIDTDLLREESCRALAQIGTSDVVDRIVGFYPGKPWHVRLYAHEPLGHIKLPASEQGLLKLLEVELALEAEPDEDDEEGEPLIDQVLLDLTDLGSLAGLEESRRQVAKYPEDVELRSVCEGLLATAAMIGQTLPDDAAWRHRVERSRQSFQDQLPAIRSLLKNLDEPRDKSESASRAVDWGSARFDAETVKRIRNVSPKVGRNDPCPCGSGKKFKKCCGK